MCNAFYEQSAVLVEYLPATFDLVLYFTLRTMCKTKGRNAHQKDGSDCPRNNEILKGSRSQVLLRQEPY